MHLKSEENVDLTGTVSNRRVIRPKSGQAFVKASLVVEGEENHVPVIWWDAGRAPQIGARVRVQGRVRVYDNQAEVHANETTVERKQPPEDPLAAIAGFYLGCIEAEMAGSLRLTLGGSTHLELVDGPSPFHGAITLPDNQAVRQWCQLRQVTIGETLVSGWPLVVGLDHRSGSARQVASPLLTTEVELHSNDDGWRLERLGDAADFNPFALELLDLDRDEREAIVTAVETSVAVEEASTPGERAEAILEVLEDAGVDGFDKLNSESLSQGSGSSPIHNTGVVMVTTASVAIVRSLVEDLEELVNTPELMKQGPVAVLLGEASAPEVPLPSPHPTIVPSSMSQDQAVHSAMESTFTVVTGPPGTGKSQVLVNVVAAAVARSEKVLFASKSNKAVDVVVDRLRLTSPHAVIIRAGNAGRRSEVAQYITETLDARPRSVDPAGARRGWRAVAEKLRLVYQVLQERVRIEGELAELLAKSNQRLGRLPSNTVLDVDLAELDSALAATRDALDAFGKRLWLFGRWRRHQRRLERARVVLWRLGSIVGFDRSEVEECLSSVADRPRRSFAPRRDFRDLEDVANDLHEVLRLRNEIKKVEARLATLPQKYILDDRLNELAKERIEAGRELLDTRWEELRTHDPAARVAASECADLIERAATKRRGLRKTLGRIPDALPVLPVWSVTNLSARTNLPLKAGLFDLVVIDEASQCDVASALPLLVRGKRALIIGDRKQLIHITSLSRGREQVIARRWGLGDDRAREFSYRDRSCFGLASARVQGSPIFLDLHFRSHPAIAGFANKQFYGGRMELCSHVSRSGDMRGIEWIRVSGQCARGPHGRSWINRDEAQAIAKEIARALPTYKGLGCSVGVVTPYRAQVEMISTLLSGVIEREDAELITVATAHRFQGDERDVMYFSPVVDRSMPERQTRFAANPNLINVALTRARKRLVVVGDIEACLVHPTALMDLARYTARLEAGGFDSPLELDLHEELLKRGIAARTGVVVRRHRLDLAIEQDGVRLDIECDGAAFHVDGEKDASRDRAIEAEGWRVLRFSGRQLSRDIEGCIKAIMESAASMTSE